MKTLIILLCCLSAGLFFTAHQQVPTTVSKTEKPYTLASDSSFEKGRTQLLKKAPGAKEFCEIHNMNTDYCVLVNMKIHSGNYRLYVWDFNTATFVDSGLVSHGCGDSTWSADRTAACPAFSNAFDSHLSSLGKYKIGPRGYSNWGIHVNYALYGLESTNNNANARQICIHSWNRISDVPVYPTGTPEGWGCVAVSDAVMTRLDTRLSGAKKPTLLWIVNE